jgi:hypothetical protein
MATSTAERKKKERKRKKNGLYTLKIQFPVACYCYQDGYDNSRHKKVKKKKEKRRTDRTLAHDQICLNGR